MKAVITLVLVCFTMIVMTLGHNESLGQHTDIILIGATGDLAKKYLWQGLFETFIKYENNMTTFTFYGCGRSDHKEGTTLLHNALDKSVSCKHGDIGGCLKRRETFVKSVKYFPLKTEIDFSNFGIQLDTSLIHKYKVMGRVVYMSIPPKAYPYMSEKMSKISYLEGQNRWNRLILEKPFGSDKVSATKMAEEIGKYYREEEIYRVDHYLGKSVVKQILPFRFANKDVLEPLLNKDHIQRVEIVMKEVVGVQGRISFYDDYGVIRDVMQNHLTELLALIAMDLPSNVTDSVEVDRNKIRLLRRVQPVKRESTLTGQYANYLSEALEERENLTWSRFTSTFGASLINIDSSRWQGVPFLLVSGKHLDERSSFVRIVFSDNEFCIAGCNHNNGSHWKGQKQIIFQIGHGNLPSAGILVSKDLFDPVYMPESMKDLPITAGDIAIYGQSLNEFSFLVPFENNDAYVSLIDDLYSGKRENFVGTERLLHLWDIWTPVLNSLTGVSPRLYTEKQDRSLNFKIVSQGLDFIYGGKFSETFEEDPYKARIVSIPATFLGHKLIADPSDDSVCKKTAMYMENIILTAVNERNVAHIALSGGRTPSKLYKYLSQSSNKIPWENVHIWQVDERCVAQEDKLSNLNMIYNQLIKHINIPYWNIHPMPVDMAGRFCSVKDEGAKVYQDLIYHHLGNKPGGQLDVIVLGVGSDGHTASLFPGTTAVKETTQSVSLVMGENISPARMTLTFPVINKALNILVLVTGREKHSILMDILDVTNVKEKYPILSVTPVHGNMTWFVDYQAWLGS